ncbi:DUF1887 family CARF protein [Lentisphaera marina]|uniref:Card1-like endonuclease domain-containing protein n=1 Tax=Lentisphaera marina TaxID=1111041 RepID=UPI002366770B|nr:DUF1887 family CARF protein [Lentisphaera marina]MDD7984708.1 DUF1887 family CARF protein [Lentisphaera marina]
MKKYLMTWYGMTDFRSSLNFEESEGPVLGALRAEDYTDVLVLAYTDKEKTSLNSSVFQEKSNSLNTESLEEQREFVNSNCNTPAAHEHFKNWVEEKLAEAGKHTKVHFHPIALKELNDTERIYEAATRALNAVAKSAGDKQVSLYLSPGTPVMAFVWAFAALRYPTLKKRLIASSQPGKPPQRIVLPNEWLEWHGRQISSNNSDSDQYDVIFHLFGEQRMPSLLGIIQFSSRKHIFVNSEHFPADVMKQFIGEAEFGEVEVDPYDPENVRTSILNQISKMPSNKKIGFNLTGGTKLMYAGSLAACRKVNATPFYFNSRNNQVVYLDDFKTVNTKLISSVETFVQLNGNNLFISKAGHWEDIKGIDNPTRLSMTKQLWNHRSTIASLYRKLVPFNDDPGRNFQFNNKNIFVSLKEGHKAEITIKNRAGKESTFRFKEWPDFARYLTGGWFEEYTYMKLKPLADAGLIRDMRIGMEISFKEENKQNNSSSLNMQLSNLLGDTYQELDISFTDGKRLYVIECKAGSVKGEFVRKLESITRYFGGIEGRGVLACCFPPKSSVVKQKAAEARNVKLMSGANLFDELEAFVYKLVDQP